jgi:hypothetical protein
MSDADNPHRPPHRAERPRVEPEIIPPGAQRGDDGVYRVRMVNPPFTVVLLLAVIALVSVAVILLVLGALLVWIPVIAFVGSLILLAFYARYYWLRLTGRIRRR